uniref:35 kDa putative salivary apyrase SP03 n=1 Tax=Phlebotomus argentipes TaxID=94469 RepID=Q0ZSU6_PHLAR|nr:35 kDa putative salivary apyrase SP03 [Phlebotomus argentipes]
MFPKFYSIALITCLIIGIIEAAPRALRFIPFAVIADLDKDSIKDAGKQFTSIVKYGELRDNGENYDLTMKSQNLHYFTRFAYNGRGAELSELLNFNSKLFTVDDKTGIVFEVKYGGNLIPWVILANGNSNKQEGMKAEWATRKGDKMYVGSTGLMWYNEKTKETNSDSMWVKEISRNGEVKSIDWHKQYEAVKKALGMTNGFVWHEAVTWSSHKKLWVFLPRKCTAEKYSRQIEETTGCNKIITANEDFTKVNAVSITDNKNDPASGFSSFKFIPGTNNEHILAIKTIEKDGATATYAKVITLTGKTLLSKKILDTKNEGVEFMRNPQGIV